MESKAWYLSKTIWVNLVMGIFGIFVAWKPDLASFLNEGNMLLLMSVVNVILRGVTKNAIELK